MTARTVSDLLSSESSFIYHSLSWMDLDKDIAIQVTCLSILCLQFVN